MRRIDNTTIETDKKVLQFDISTNGLMLLLINGGIFYDF